MRHRRLREGAVAGAGALGAAGWLFAELAMVLVIIAVGTEQAPPRADPPLASPPTTTSATPGAPEGLSLTSRTFTMPLPGSDRAVLDTFVAELNRQVSPDGHVGLILLFGTSGNANAPAQGTRLSRRLRDIIGPAGIPQLRSVSEIRTYFGGDGGAGTVTVELFLLTRIG